MLKKTASLFFILCFAQNKVKIFYFCLFICCCQSDSNSSSKELTLFFVVFISHTTLFLASLKIKTEFLKNNPLYLYGVFFKYSIESLSKDPIFKDWVERAKNGEDVYSQFIEFAKNLTIELLKSDSNLYTEDHHILPKFAGGKNILENMVKITFPCHIMAHYIRWLVYRENGDKMAWSIMSAESIDARKIKQSIAGQIGGVQSQIKARKEKTGWFSSEVQSSLGKKGAAVNKAQGTGAWDPKNLEKANKALQQNPEKHFKQNSANLRKGLETQKEQGINIWNSKTQRLKSLKAHGVKLNGIRYSLDTEQRTYISDTTLDYYLEYAPKKK